ncbi:MAG: hypothetical protein PVJ09_04860 [Candidatus Woesebacteria bacterium]|jgi:hypothetical protein
MKRLVLRFFLLFLAFFAFVFPVKANEASDEAKAMEQKITIHLFASKTCPHCQDEKEFLLDYQEKNPNIKVNIYYIENRNNAKLLNLVARKLDTDARYVPFTIIANQAVSGFASADSTGQKIIELVDYTKEKNLIDLVSETVKKFQIIPEIEKLENLKEKKHNADKKTAEITSLSDLNLEDIYLPFIGSVSVKKLSLPVFTFVIAFLDGFNPCAMWTLLFLISLLLSMEDRKRMYLLGITFISVSGLVYFLFMTAWLNFFLFIGFIPIVRILIGLIALAAGSYYLRDFAINKEGACKTDFGGKKQKVFAKLKEITYRQQLILALIGISLLAFAVNLVELVCSAGLPAVYTKVLSMSNLATWQYYLYLVFYIFIFMLDDIFVFVVAMKTLQMVGLNSKYARYSHLIGGILMILIGLAMLLKPELLSFA